MDKEDRGADVTSTESTMPASLSTNNKITEGDKVEPTESSENSKNSKAGGSVTPAENEAMSNGTNNGESNLNTSKNTEENVDDISDAMMENLQENFNQDVDSMVSLMESAEDFMFESDDKQLNIKAAIEANKRKKEQESKNVINSDKSEAYSLLAQGKRNLFVKDYESAVTTLGEACQKLNSIYGDFAVELADAYMTYGNALLELWRVEEADKKNNEDENTEIGDIQEENEGDNDAEKDTNDTENDAENKSDENKESEEDDENEGKNEDGEEDIENEDDNLQIAWEVVELAKEIYIRHNDNINSAKAYLKLGEISIASGNYVLAIEDLSRSLDIQKNLNVAENRLKANTHFNLYVAYSASHNYDKSAEQLDTATSVFKTQVYELSQKLKTIDKSNVSEINKITKEINDTEEIIRDMDSKVLENNKHKREFMTALFEAIKNKSTSESNQSGSSNNLQSGTSSNNLLLSGESSNNVPVNNISHLIHKKPKKIEPVDKNHSPSKPNAVTQNGESSLGNKTESNCDSESSVTTANSSEGKNDGQEINERKRKLSESCDKSPKKVCLEHD